MLNKYNEKKPRSQEVIKYSDKHLSEGMKIRCKECGSYIEFLADFEVTKMKVHTANFCKFRFCSICGWRQACKDAAKISVLMDYIKAEHKKEFVFVTLTAPNVKADVLRDEITRYNKAFKNLTERGAIKIINHGYIRKLEITYNVERDDYHPHFHCVFAVNKSYFSGEYYIRQERWLNLWRELMKDETITQVDVRRVKSNNDKEMREFSKYAAKDEDYTHSQDVFDAFYYALKGRQAITYNGIFADANRMYKDKELDYYKTRDDTEYVWLILYQWGGVEYVEKRRREITQEEYKQLKKKSVDEMALS